MYYYFYHGFDLHKIIQFLCKFECIEFECNRFVLVLVLGGLFWRQLSVGGNWLHIIFQRIVLEASQNWRELVQHYFLADCFGGSSDGLFRDRFLLDLRSFFGARLGSNWCTTIRTTRPIYAKSSDFYAKLNLSNLNVMHLY